MGGSSATDERVYFRPSLPPSLPVVASTIQSLVSVAAKQRLFIAGHADKLKLEMEEELAASAATSALASGSAIDGLEAAMATPPEGEWRLNGFSIDDRAVIDFVRASPDLLSNLEYFQYQKTGLLAKISKFFKFGKVREERHALNVADDLAYVLSVAEVIEINGHVLAIVSHALSSQSPKIGKPLVRELAFELSNSRHRGDQHSMYMLATVKHEQQHVASGRPANTLHVGLSLYLHKPAILGVGTGVAANVSGVDTDDVPSVDVEPGELKRVLSNKGVFCASAGSDFVLRPGSRMSSERAAKVATVAVERLVDASNDALAAFFERESEEFAMERAAQKANIEEELRDELKAEREAELAREAKEMAEIQRVENAARIRRGEEPVSKSQEGDVDWW